MKRVLDQDNREKNPHKCINPMQCFKDVLIKQKSNQPTNEPNQKSPVPCLQGLQNYFPLEQCKHVRTGAELQGEGQVA